MSCSCSIPEGVFGKRAQLDLTVLPFLYIHSTVWNTLDTPRVTNSRHSIVLHCRKLRPIRHFEKNVYHFHTSPHHVINCGRRQSLYISYYAAVSDFLSKPNAKHFIRNAITDRTRKLNICQYLDPQTIHTEQKTV